MTHNIEEAVFMCDRILVLGSNGDRKRRRERQRDRTQNVAPQRADRGHEANIGLDLLVVAAVQALAIERERPCAKDEKSSSKGHEMKGIEEIEHRGRRTKKRRNNLML